MQKHSGRAKRQKQAGAREGRGRLRPRGELAPPPPPQTQAVLRGRPSAKPVQTATRQGTWMRKCIVRAKGAAPSPAGAAGYTCVRRSRGPGGRGWACGLEGARGQARHAGWSVGLCWQGSPERYHASPAAARRPPPRQSIARRRGRRHCPPRQSSSACRRRLGGTARQPTAAAAPTRQTAAAAARRHRHPGRAKPGAARGRRSCRRARRLSAACQSAKGDGRARLRSGARRALGQGEHGRQPASSAARLGGWGGGQAAIYQPQLLPRTATITYAAGASRM